MDAGDLPSQVTSDPPPEQDEQMYPLNANRVNVRWESHLRTEPVPNAYLCYDISAAVQSNYALYKNALAVRQIGVQNRIPCSFDLFVWIPEHMHTDKIRQPGSRRLSEDEPCLKSIRDPRTGSCEPVVHIRPGSQFSTPSGYFALADEMTAKLPPSKQQDAVARTVEVSTETTAASVIGDVHGSSSENWWIWVIVGLSIVLVLIVSAIVCGAIAYKRNANKKKSKKPTVPKEIVISETKNKAALDRARKNNNTAIMPKDIPKKSAPKPKSAPKTAPKKSAPKKSAPKSASDAPKRSRANLHPTQ